MSGFVAETSGQYAQYSADYLPDNPVYKDFVILFVRLNKPSEVIYRGRAQNFAVPGGLERKITFDSDIFPTINQVYRQLTSYIDHYRKVN